LEILTGLGIENYAERESSKVCRKYEANLKFPLMGGRGFKTTNVPWGYGYLLEQHND